MKESWSKREAAVFAKQSTPMRIQEWLDATPYSLDPIYRSPRRVMKDRRAHCVDGGLFAAAALRRLQFPPLVVWITAENDDGHLLAVFKERGLWGAVAKSNYPGMRYREPVYRGMRELVMSYFNEYFNTLGQRTMRGFSGPMDLRNHDRLRWMTQEDGLEQLLDVELERLPVEPVIPRGAKKWMTHVDSIVMESGSMGVDPRGQYKPKAE
jgi:succinate dehydrogenase flavin-adding protein (antitoxin of CptAB toxin-antitoxin module)